MRRFLGFTVVVAVLLLPTTAFGATNFFLSGSSAAEKKGFTPTISASWPDFPTLGIGFRKSSGRVSNNTQTTQSHTWSFSLEQLQGAAHSLNFTANLASGHVRSGGKMGTYGNVNLTWKSTGPLKTSHPCDGETVQTRAGRLDGTMRLKAGGDWKTITVTRYNGTVTKMISDGDGCPFPPPKCSDRVSLFGFSPMPANPAEWRHSASVFRSSGRTSVFYSASRLAGRANLSKSISELIPNSQLKANVPSNGNASVELNIPAARAVSGKVELGGPAFPMGDTCDSNQATIAEASGSLKAKFFGLGTLTLPAGGNTNWLLSKTVG